MMNYYKSAYKILILFVFPHIKTNTLNSKFILMANNYIGIFCNFIIRGFSRNLFLMGYLWNNLSKKASSMTEN